MESLKMRLRRVYQQVTLSYGALRADLARDTVISKDDINAAVARALADAADDLFVVLQTPDMVLNLPSPTDTDCEDEFPAQRGADYDVLRADILAREMRVQCAALAEQQQQEHATEPVPPAGTRRGRMSR